MNLSDLANLKILLGDPAYAGLSDAAIVTKLNTIVQIKLPEKWITEQELFKNMTETQAEEILAVLARLADSTKTPPGLALTGTRVLRWLYSDGPVRGLNIGTLGFRSWLYHASVFLGPGPDTPLWKLQSLADHYSTPLDDIYVTSGPVTLADLTALRALP